MKKQIPFLKDPERVSPQSRQGFSLVEVAMAVMIFSLMVGYAVPSVMTSMTNGRLERGSSRLSFQLQQARSFALSNNQSVFLGLDTSTNELTVWMDADRDGSRDSGEEEVIEVGDPSTVSITSSWTSALFNSHGQFLTSQNQRTVSTETVTFTSSSKSKTLTIRGSGSVTRE